MWLRGLASKSTTVGKHTLAKGVVMRDTTTLVVGAGPVGLTAAVVLTQLGHAVTVVDRQGAAANTSRAAVVHAHTLELLEPYGVVPDLVARGVPISTFTIRDRDDLLIRVPFDRLPTPYPYTLMISQADTEAILLNRLTELGATVARPAEVAGLHRHRDGVQVTFGDGAVLQARYVIGADGMHSTVRDQARIAFRGASYAESFTLADVRLRGGVPADEVVLYFAPAGLLVVAPLPDGLSRIVATVPAAPSSPDTGFVQRLLDERGPQRVPAVVDRVVWGSRFRVHHRLADTFGADRILLAGDAAHVHSPAGGQGMNLGIEDAVALGQALARVLGGDAATRLDAADRAGVLDGYAAERRRTAGRVVAATHRLTTVATLRRRAARNHLLRALGAVPTVRHALAWRLSGLDRR
ncbi:FAD-dependent oxidoreductase [Mycolicibacillus parakoreensis]|uniref:FAD-dependent oxidoreductase n=2 Tax=Mycobacteriaceae TaxID=1762 RepID=A0ABY3TXX7_9MYCO|nr:FAD-dependent oxidoreductase [Mycolicibacillus parakoreensis]ULN52067.2 FAD-dependent oxidoreductase [Mycolicibacillus parakoreensis]